MQKSNSESKSDYTNFVLSNLFSSAFNTLLPEPGDYSFKQKVRS